MKKKEEKIILLQFLCNLILSFNEMRQNGSDDFDLIRGSRVRFINFFSVAELKII